MAPIRYRSLADLPRKEVPIPHGCSEWQTESGITICQILYSADPAKDNEWLKAQEKKSADNPAGFQQEILINFAAYAGQRVFPNFHKGINVQRCWKWGCPVRCPIPHHFTRYFCCDPHPRVPHAHLWMAVSPEGFHIYYRESWLSRIYARMGAVPEDDKRYTILDYAQLIKRLESKEIDFFHSGGYANNDGADEHIEVRFMDPYGKAVAADREDGKESAKTFWDRYLEEGIHCIEAKKDFDVSVEKVNARLRPARYQGPDDVASERPVIIVLDVCPELILELEQNRYPKLSPEQAAKRDPDEKPLQMRKHMTDNMRYIEIFDPVYIDRSHSTPSVRTLTGGVSY
jgi:hypothetical protein